MKKSILILFLIIALIVIGFVFFNDTPVVSNEFDEPYIPKKEIQVPAPVACYNEDEIEIDCKG